MRSGVDAPLRLGRGGERVFGFRFGFGFGFGVEIGFEGLVGVSGEKSIRFWGVPIVVLRWRLVVSVEGGGGGFCRLEMEGERMLARQRKHSPVPK